LYSVGYAVTYPRKYKQSRATLSRPALWSIRSTIRTNEGLAVGHELPHDFIRNTDLEVLADCASAYPCCRVLPVQTKERFEHSS
jgi:hypothetical protein